MRNIPTVFLHGFLGNPSDWNPIVSILKETECICPELPGHGKTPFTKDFFSLLPELSKMHLVGYSMGGRLAMQYAERFPEQIASLTILSSHPGLKTESERIERKENDKAWSKLLRNSFDDFLIKWYDQPIFGGYRPCTTLRKMHDPVHLEKTFTFYSLANQKVMNPQNTLYLVGERDIKFRKLHPKGIIVPGAAHMVHLENPLFVANAIKRQVS